MTRPPDALLITRADIVRVMTPRLWLDAAETAFRSTASGMARSPQPLHLPMADGGFHAKGASLTLDRDYAAVKVNGNFPANPAELGLPTVQGAIVLADGSNGVLLAILDSIEVTLRRTAAASALAAKLLARPRSDTLLVCGCGEQGRAHVEALGEVLPFEHILLWDRDEAAAKALAQSVGGTPVSDLGAASLSADIIACCTSAREPFLDVGMVKLGTFIAAVGADSPGKNEIAPALMAASTIVTDSTEQCLAMGDLRHAIAAGAMPEPKVRAELPAIVAGEQPGRRTSEEIIIFDSTGTGLQDVAAAVAIYELSLAAGAGLRIALGGSGNRR
jgi:ornithine cyclodeaminase/alanine dehydrogenase-like protein (mu-crystallin family)